jgi:hyaluronoglucosaminidase
MNEFELGIIEGFFGDSWSWNARDRYARWLADAGYQFYIYAPKDDRYLRRAWMEDWPTAQLDALQALATTCRAHGVKFGIGLSPFEAYKDYSASVRARLIEKVRLIEQTLSPNLFCVLFDDMRGDTPDLANTQLRIIEDVAASTTAARIVMCPTYYSTDPVLERVFGAMPAGYLDALGNALDSRIDLFWTGPKVCSTEYPHEHLEAVATQLRRKPFLWDNYPVNDSRVLSSFLLLRAFTNRPTTLRGLLAGHAANPMKQPTLSRLPLATLPMSYALADRYAPDDAWLRAAQREGGDALATRLALDLPLFQDVGLDKLSDEQRATLEQTYTAFAPRAIAEEILAWLRGEYVFDPACLTD